MINSLRGIVLSKRLDAVTVEVGGVGYEVFVPLKTFSTLSEEGHSIFLHIQTVMREDGIFLFGFSSMQEKDVFNLLRMAKGVGVKTALSLLSTYNAEELIGHVIAEDAAALSKVPGIGKKTAERIIFELKDRMNKAFESVPVPAEKRIELDVEMALTSLGYSLSEARQAIRKSFETLSGTLTIEGIIKESLRHLVKR